MKIERTVLLEALKKCQPGVDNSSQGVFIEGADCFVFRNNRVLTFNDYLSVSAEFEHDLSCAVYAEPLLKLLRAFRAKEVELSQGEGVLHIKCGNSTTELTTTQEGIYTRYESVFPEAPVWKNVPKGFDSALKHCLIPNMTKLSGVLIDGTWMIATDGVTVVRVDLDAQMERVWISNKVVADLVKFEFNEYCTQGAWLHFKGNGTILSARVLMNSSYPDNKFHELLDSFDGEAQGTFDKEVVSIVKSACVLADESKEGGHCIEIEVAEDRIWFRTNNSMGKFNEFVEMGIAGKPGTIMVDGKRLLKALQHSPNASFYITGKRGGEALVLSGEGWKEFVCGIVK